MALLRYGLSAMMAALLLCLVFIAAVAGAFRGLGLDASLDTGAPLSDAFFGPFGLEAAIYNRFALATSRPQVVLIGASNMQKVYAADFRQSLPGYRVSNMSVAGSSTGDFPLLVDLAYEAMPAAARGRRVFVLGLWYGQFMRARGDASASIGNELTRFGLYRLSPAGGVHRRVGQRLLEPALTAIRPVVFEQRMWDSLSSSAAGLGRFAMRGDAGPVTVDMMAQNGFVANAAALRARLLAFRREARTTIDPASFAAIAQIARVVSGRGDRLIIADLPLPSWHTDGVASFAVYERARAGGLAPALALPGVSYLDLQHSLRDDEFYDSTHPRPAAAQRIADLIAGAVRAAPASAGSLPPAAADTR